MYISVNSLRPSPHAVSSLRAGIKVSGGDPSKDLKEPGRHLEEKHAGTGNTLSTYVRRTRVKRSARSSPSKFWLLLIFSPPPHSKWKSKAENFNQWFIVKPMIFTKGCLSGRHWISGDKSQRLVPHRRLLRPGGSTDESGFPRLSRSPAPRLLTMCPWPQRSVPLGLSANMREWVAKNDA